MEAFEAYLSGIPKEHRVRTEEILHWVPKQFPDLHPKVAWNQPMFTDHGTFIIGFSVSKQHVAVSPEKAGILHFAKEIEKAGYTHGSHLFRIRWEEAVNYELLEKMIAYNISEKAECSAFWRK